MLGVGNIVNYGIVVVMHACGVGCCVAIVANASGCVAGC